jgi:hypothetical protein
MLFMVHIWVNINNDLDFFYFFQIYLFLFIFYLSIFFNIISTIIKLSSMQ